MLRNWLSSTGSLHIPSWYGIQLLQENNCNVYNKKHIHAFAYTISFSFFCVCVFWEGGCMGWSSLLIIHANKSIVITFRSMPWVITNSFPFIIMKMLTTVVIIWHQNPFQFRSMWRVFCPFFYIHHHENITYRCYHLMAIPFSV